MTINLDIEFSFCFVSAFKDEKKKIPDTQVFERLLGNAARK